MVTLLRQLLIAAFGGGVAAGILLFAGAFPGQTEGERHIALAQTSANVVAPDAADADAAKVINYQGQVFNPNNGLPYTNAPLNFSFRLYNNLAGTNQVYIENKFIVTNADGFFSTNIGDTATINNLYSIFNGQELYLRVYINDQELTPLQPVTFVPYAFWSVHAHHLDNYDAEDFPKIIAYGVINADGSRRSGRNFNSFRDNVGGSQVYLIDLAGVDDHSVDQYTTIVTPACQSPATPGIGSSGEFLVVDLWNPNGDRITCTFQFMTLAR